MEPKSNNKRMIYVYEENLEFYDGLANKSELINALLFAEKKKQVKPQPNIEYVRNKLAEMDAKAKGE